MAGDQHALLAGRHEVVATYRDSILHAHETGVAFAARLHDSPRLLSFEEEVCVDLSALHAVNRHPSRPSVLSTLTMRFMSPPSLATDLRPTSDQRMQAWYARSAKECK